MEYITALRQNSEPRLLWGEDKVEDCIELIYQEYARPILIYCNILAKLPNKYIANQDGTFHSYCKQQD